MENKIKRKKRKKVIKSTVFNSGITSSSRFLSNFLKYSFSNFLLFYLYNIFAIYFSGNSPLFKSFSSAISSFSCYLTSVLNLFSNSTIIFFIFFKSSSLSYILFSTVNPFYYTKYFITPLIFLFRIFLTSYSLTLSTSTDFNSSTFCPPTYFLYYAIQLTFMTRQILIEVGSCDLTILIDTTSSIIYEPIYQSTSFSAGLFLNTKSFILNIILSSFFYFSASLYYFFYYFIMFFFSLCTSSPSLAQILSLLLLYDSTTSLSAFSHLLSF